MSLETLERMPMPDFNDNLAIPGASELTEPPTTLFDVVGQDFKEWEDQLDKLSPNMDTMASSPTTAATGKTDYDWD